MQNAKTLQNMSPSRFLIYFYILCQSTIGLVDKALFEHESCQNLVFFDKFCIGFKKIRIFAQFSHFSQKRLKRKFLYFSRANEIFYMYRLYLTITSVSVDK